MNAQVNINLEGAFKADLYSGGQFQYTTEWFSNFITHSGLSYPKTYAFADCFRYLSLGYGTAENSGQKMTPRTPGTTGLNLPLAPYSTSIGQQSATYIGWQGYETSSCGTTFTKDGLSYFRAWMVPTGTDAVCTESAGLTIQEFMVSPSSGEDPNGRCAFSRVRKSLTIKNGWSAIVTYQLKIKILNSGSGISILTGNSFDVSNADTTNDGALVSGWKQLSGYYRQVYPGLTCVAKDGASYVSSYGAIMEPSLIDLSNSVFYLSPDNSAFAVNKSGGFQTDENSAYRADGLMGFYGDMMSEDPCWAGKDKTLMTDEEKNVYYTSDAFSADHNENSSTKNPNIILNPRLGSSAGIILPSLSNYGKTSSLPTNFNYQNSHDASTQEISYATPGASGYDSELSNFGQKAVFSTRVFRNPPDNDPTTDATARKRRQTRRTSFSPVSSLGYNTRFGSLVYAYQPVLTTTIPNKSMYATIDCLFFDSSGRSLPQHYRQISGVSFYERGSGVAEAYINITPNGENINRFKSRKLFCGPIDSNGFNFTNSPGAAKIYSDYLEGKNMDICGGSDMRPRNGDIQGIEGVEPTGWGGVIGIVENNFSSLPLDCGILDQNMKFIAGRPFLVQNGKPDNTTTLTWNDSPLVLNITGIKYQTTYGIKTSGELASAGYSWATNLQNLCPPTGRITHYESLPVWANDAPMESGNRLLPGYGVENNQGVNTYSPTKGGYYPGLSMDNGLDLYLDIIWGAGCSGAATNTCVEPTI